MIDGNIIALNSHETGVLKMEYDKVNLKTTKAVIRCAGCDKEALSSQKQVRLHYAFKQRTDVFHRECANDFFIGRWPSKCTGTQHEMQ